MQTLIPKDIPLFSDYVKQLNIMIYVFKVQHAYRQNELLQKI